ncbi:unnamed protein product [Protopolystoma xenopodis]|uniref:Uncharacterized protein n=1 Tax=Protopolystoma xenopodis TaxID=117903 RepID=A0A448WYZ3_9PLAT|nr:unnamed protein product [Protopolystoma xenopodis]
MARVKAEFLQHLYQLPAFAPILSVSDQQIGGHTLTTQSNAVSNKTYPPEALWPSNPDLFLELIARQTGKLLKVRCLQVITFFEDMRPGRGFLSFYRCCLTLFPQLGHIGRKT